MRARSAVIVAAVILGLFLAIWPAGQRAAAAEINILPYYVPGSVGDYWTYAFIFPSGTPDFTVNLTQVTSGPLTGKYRYGDFVDIIDTPHLQYRIGDWDSSGINIYELNGVGFSPPVKIDALQQLEAIITTFPDDPSHVHYFQQLSSLTVLAGTFADILVDITLTKDFGPNDANTEFGLDPSITYGVTHVVWMVAGIGEIQNRDYEYSDEGKMLFEYQLKDTSVTLPVSTVPLPAPLVMLGSGLLGLIGWRKIEAS